MLPDPHLVATGREIFNDQEVGCGGCHDADWGFASEGNHDVQTMLREEVAEMRDVDPRNVSRELNTPSLLYAGLTAPYFHNGTVATLEDLIDTNEDRMGKTSHLSAVERRALVAYLESL